MNMKGKPATLKLKITLLKAIDELLEERPMVAGIALPGMPGMKTEAWVIYGINLDGTFEKFMRY